MRRRFKGNGPQSAPASAIPRIVAHDTAWRSRRTSGSDRVSSRRIQRKPPLGGQGPAIRRFTPQADRETERDKRPRFVVERVRQSFRITNRTYRVALRPPGSGTWPTTASGR